MKKLLILFAILNVLACKEKTSETIVGLQFNDHKKINQFANFDKVSDTTFYNDEIGYELSLLHLNNGKKDLVIFANIWNDSENIRNYKILDTLTISNLDKGEKLTIGYCALDLRNKNKGNVIALVENTDSKNMFITKIKDAWVANPNSKKIEQLKNIGEVDCFNEWYNGEETKINYDLLDD